jgi:hypothetical protein
MNRWHFPPEPQKSKIITGRNPLANAAIPLIERCQFFKPC